jgi:lysyl-tRNA synthetase class I
MAIESEAVIRAENRTLRAEVAALREDRERLTKLIDVCRGWIPRYAPESIKLKVDAAIRAARGTTPHE